MAVGWAREGDTEKETENAIALEIYLTRKRMEWSEGAPRTECVECDKPIPPARLKIFPRTQYCVGCLSSME